MKIIKNSPDPRAVFQANTTFPDSGALGGPEDDAARLEPPNTTGPNQGF